MSKQQAIQLAFELSKSFEGFRDQAYPDPLTGGDPITNGYGSTRDERGRPWRLGDPITESRAANLKRAEMERIWTIQSNRIPRWERMHSHKQAALLSFSYNLGAHWMGSQGFETLSRNIKDGAYILVPETLRLYRNPSSTVEAGLLRRRIAEGELWQRGLDASLSAAEQPPRERPIKLLNCALYWRGLPHQVEASGWLDRLLVNAPAMPLFASKYRDGVVNSQPITLANALRYYDERPHQAEALDWLENQISDNTLTQFAKRWRADTDQRIPAPELSQQIDWNNPAQRISEFFTVGEVTRNDPRRIPKDEQTRLNILLHARNLDEVRRAWGSPILVTSWYRPPAVNAAVGGVSNSQHIRGTATDSFPANGQAYRYEQWLDRTAWATKAVGYGVKNGRGFTHLDERAGRFRWDY
jgi:GH24 family phage-related lysozyme (muramidase)/uncharacterized protein YcbK (DUF882 family)